MSGGVCQQLARDLRELLRVVAEKQPKPTAMSLDSRTIQSTPPRGGRVAYDSAKRRKESKVHRAVDTLGNLSALQGSVASEPDRA